MFAALVPELYVTDYARSLYFYTTKLGFAVSYTRPTENFAYLDREGAQLMIEQPGERVWLRGDLAFPYGRGINLQIATFDVQGMWQSLTGGAEIILPLETRTYRRKSDVVEVRQFVIADPDGYLLRFSEAIGTRPIRPVDPPASP